VVGFGLGNYIFYIERLCILMQLPCIKMYGKKMFTNCVIVVFFLGELFNYEKMNKDEVSLIIHRWGKFIKGTELIYKVY